MLRLIKKIRVGILIIFKQGPPFCRRYFHQKTISRANLESSVTGETKNKKLVGAREVLDVLLKPKLTQIPALRVCPLSPIFWLVN